MGNYLSKVVEEEEEELTCSDCVRLNIEPEYFTKQPNNILVEKIKNSKVECFDKYRNKINTETIEEISCTPSFIYVCSYGHKLNNM
jgi:hypothetical protein